MANAHRLVWYKYVCQDKFLHKEVILRDSILGHKFQHNVLIKRKGNIQCFVVSPVNGNSSDLEGIYWEARTSCSHTPVFSKFLKQSSRELSSSEALLLSLTYCFLHAFFPFVVTCHWSHLDFFTHTVWPLWIQNTVSERMFSKPPT